MTREARAAGGMTDFEALIEEYADALVALARVLTGDRHAAEDLAQDTVDLAFRKRHLVLAADHPHAYLRRVLVNVHLASVRRRGPTTVLLDDVTHLVAPQSGLSPEDTDALRHAVRRLPPRQRTVLVLRYLEDLDVAEIAHAMSLREASVRSTLARALAALRTQLTSEADADRGRTRTSERRVRGA